MPGLVDLHVHLLPGVDDGPATLEESLEHADRLVCAGVSEAVVTPHVGHPSFELPVHEIPERTALLQRALGAAGIGLRLHVGGEIHPRVAGELTPDELAIVAQGAPDRRWVLLEPPWDGVDDAFVASCDRMRGIGLGVLVAHPERSAGFLPDGLACLGDRVGDGLLLQVGVCSLLGHHGDEARATASALVHAGLAAVLASDGHGGRRRQTLLDGYAIVARSAPAAARRLTSSGPARLLANGMASRRSSDLVLTG